MKKVLAFAGSNSSKSINKRLVEYAASLLSRTDVKIIDLRDFEAPIYSMDMEEETGAPVAMKELNKLFNECDGFIISAPEYNSGITPVLKNTIDWISRVERPTFKNKPVLLMATSAGGRGGKTNMEHMATLMPRWGGELVASFSLPNFQQNMHAPVYQLTHNEYRQELLDAIEKLEQALE
ncbi:NADPH-dependent oxidoreductase [Prolixibacteraceae bacterium JC049]|nr:NADPH-dependent oxidoreductase [Prolixibacteraceae bacterium JC049]